MTSHTPAPWRLERDPSHYGSLTTVVAGVPMRARRPLEQMIVQVGGYCGLAEQEANARLIAGAPDVCCAAERLLQSIDEMDPEQWHCSTVAYSDLRRALEGAGRK